MTSQILTDNHLTCWGVHTHYSFLILYPTLYIYSFISNKYICRDWWLTVSFLRYFASPDLFWTEGVSLCFLIPHTAKCLKKAAFNTGVLYAFQVVVYCFLTCFFCSRVSTCCAVTFWINFCTARITWRNVFHHYLGPNFPLVITLSLQIAREDSKSWTSHINPNEFSHNIPVHFGPSHRK